MIGEELNDFVDLVLAFGRLQNEALLATISLETLLETLANANKDIFRNGKQHKKQIRYVIPSRSMK